MTTIHRLGLATLVWLAFLLVPLTVHARALASQHTIISEATYVMADKDTLADAEQFALTRAQRKAIEQTGIYIESAFYDVEHSGGRKSADQRSSLTIRTLAAAILHTTVLDREVHIEQGRPALYVRIRTIIETDRLNDAIRHLYHQDLQLSQSVQLQHENAQLKDEVAHLRHVQFARRGVNFIQIESPERLRQAALLSSTWSNKIDLTTRAITVNPRDHIAYAMRGHALLGMARTTITRTDRTRLLNLAHSDFSMSLSVNAAHSWALFGLGEMFALSDQYEAAVDAYWRLLQVDPLFDLGRQRMLAAAVALAHTRINQAQWPLALPPLNLLLGEEPLPTWVAQQAEAYLLRSQIFTALRQPALAEKDLTTLLKFAPDHRDALYRRGRLYEQVGAGDFGRKDLAQACRLGVREAC